MAASERRDLSDPYMVGTLSPAFHRMRFYLPPPEGRLFHTLDIARTGWYISKI